MQRPDFEQVQFQGEQLTKAHEKLQELQATELQITKELQDAAYVIYLKTLDENLSQISIDHMGFATHDIPVDAMKQAGIRTAADLRSAKRSELLAIEGMSGKALENVFDSLADMRKLAEKKTAVRLQADHKDQDQEKLVLGLYRYINLSSLYEELRDMEAQYQDGVSEKIENSRMINTRTSWIFSKKAEKNKVSSAAFDVSALYNTGYVKRVEAAYQRYDTVMAVPAETAWQDFTQNSVNYYTNLERFLDNAYDEAKRTGATVQIPRKPVSGDMLPMEIADEVENFELNTSALKATLRNYQTFGVKYMLSQQKTLLGDEMGLGKTVQAIAAMAHLYANGGTHFMVIAPASVLINWTREIEKFCTMKPWLLHGLDFADNLIGWYNHGGVAVTNFESAAKVLDANMNVRISMLVVDEAHFVKNPQARRTQNVRTLARMSDHAVFMTGTPLENNVEEMCNLIGMLSSALKGKLSTDSDKFEKQACSVYLRRVRSDVLSELPDKTETEEWCDLATEEKKAYRKEVLNANFMGMRQVSWNVDNLELSSKANRLKELVDKAVEDGRKVIVFSFFLKTLDKVAEMFGDAAAGPISGAIPTDERQQIIDEFTASETKNVLVAQAVSAGTGLNIQAASVVIFCEPQIKPSIETQAIARAYRMGQVHDVLVYRLLADNTVDERIMEILAEKQGIFDAFAEHSLVGDENMRRIDSEDSAAAEAAAENQAAAEEKANEGQSASEGITAANSKTIIAAEMQRIQEEEKAEAEAEAETAESAAETAETVETSEQPTAGEESAAEEKASESTEAQAEPVEEAKLEKPKKQKKARTPILNRKEKTRALYAAGELFTQGTYSIGTHPAPGEYFIRVQDSREQAAHAVVYMNENDKAAGQMKEEFYVDEARLVALVEGEIITLERADLVKAGTLAQHITVRSID